MKALHPPLFTAIVLAIALTLPDKTSAMLIAECADPAYIEAQASLIVEGEVTDVRYERNAAGHVFTYVTIRVKKYLRGQGQEELIIKQFGGQYQENGETITVSDADSPDYSVGQSGLLYLLQPDTAFYAGRFYTTVCATGVSPAAVP